MKLLLDENLPHKLRTLLPEHECFTVTFMGWTGVENGELLRLAAANHFEVFITNDKGLEYQQNQANLPLSIIVLLADDNKLRTLESLMPRVLDRLRKLKGNKLIKIKASKL